MKRSGLMNNAGSTAVGDEKKRRNSPAEQIKRLILKAGLKSGDAVPTEAELCQILGISRTSVREAIKTLATLDIVDVRHGRGTVVGKMSLAPFVETLVFRGVVWPGDELSALRDVVELRQALDLSLADRVVAAHRGHTNQSLAALVDKMEETAGKGKTFLPEDRQFHAKLFAPIKNELATQLVTAFWDIHTAVAPKLGVAPLSDLRRTAKAHRDILNAAQGNDVEAYRIAIAEHYDPLARALDLACNGAREAEIAQVQQ